MDLAWRRQCAKEVLMHLRGIANLRKEEMGGSPFLLARRRWFGSQLPTLRPTTVLQIERGDTLSFDGRMVRKKRIFRGSLTGRKIRKRPEDQNSRAVMKWKGKKG